MLFDEINNLLKDRKIGTYISPSEVREALKSKYRPKSILLSDFCYNRINNGIPFDKHIFEYAGRNLYIYLGENYPYNGKIYHKPIKAKKENVVGYWYNGRYEINFD